ncbi:MAG: YebC/PmpR family DNA-binding transcriptional regulator [Verrucomicrobiota bacterium]|nr:YebC/PmpR family DNA-binding transcriptional regulator [Verrucomicrobiota bacterium]
MSGHSKWATTKRHKAVIDAKKGKIFSVLSKELTLAARSGGGDPNFNPRLRTVVLKAKSVNMPSDNVERAIKKGTGELPGMVYEEFVYEGYAPGGVGIIVEVTTDNKNRAVGEVRSTFTKHGGNLAGAGALAFNFQRKGQFLIDAAKTTEDKLMEVVLEAGADDIVTEETHFEVLCSVAAYDNVSNALQKAGISPDSSEIAYIPNTYVDVTDAESAKKLLHLIEVLEDLEDVQHVFANHSIPDGLVT